MGLVDAFSLSGKVLDQNGNGIAGARVNLKSGVGTETVTTAAGDFTLDATSIYPNSSHRKPSSDVFARRGELYIRVGEHNAGRTVQLFSPTGRQMYSYMLPNASLQWHKCPFTSGNLADGLYFLQVGPHRNEGLYKLFLETEHGFVLSGKPIRVQAVGLQKPSKRMAVIDTLVVMAAGYAYNESPVNDGALTGITITMLALNPWQPLGALETNTEGMVKIVSKGHTFEMGQPNPNIWGKGKSKKEQPVRTISFTYDFWMDTVEVSQSKYESLMRESYPKYSTPDFAFSIGDDFPANSVVWGDAALYSNAKSKKEGFDTVYSYSSISGIPGNNCELKDVVVHFDANGYRLPTEAEWEYAAKGGTFTDYYWNKNFTPQYPTDAAENQEINLHAVWAVNSWDLGPDALEFGPYQVGSKQKNNYGLYDMLGNLFEWCNDVWTDYDPAELVDPVGPETGKYRSLRGGSWGSDISYLRSANRYSIFPDYQYFFVGFRVVRPIK